VEQLRDIKDLVDIPDLSFWLYVALLFFVTLAVALAVYGLIRLVSRKKVDERQRTLERLRRIAEEGDAKKIAYAVTLEGPKLIRDSSALKIYEELLRRLARYKYKKKVPPLDGETRRYLELFLRMGRDG